MSEKREESEKKQSAFTEIPTLDTPVNSVDDTKELEPEEIKSIETVGNEVKTDQEESAPSNTVSEAPSLPQIIVNDNEPIDPMPDLAINDESFVMDEPQTPVPCDLMSETTADDSSITASSHSTVRSESLNNDDTKPIVMDQFDFQGPVIDFYKNKNILMTGVTGFIGKAILWKLVQALRQDLGYIYILIRSGSIKRSKIGRPSERLRNEVLNNKVIMGAHTKLI